MTCTEAIFSEPSFLGQRLEELRDLASTDAYTTALRTEALLDGVVLGFLSGGWRS